LRNSNDERTGELSIKESVGWDQLFYEGTSAGELVDVLDRQDANSNGPILKEWAYEMDDEGMPL
jgi:hypothetical protein